MLKELLTEFHEQSERINYFISNIEKDTIDNKNFRQVLFTARDLQLVVMSLKPNEEIGEEVHESIDQFFRVERGEGKVIINGKTSKLSDGSAFIIPQGMKHNIVNTSKVDDLKLYTIYAPPKHLKNVVHKTRADASKDEEHFDSDTDVM